MLFLNGERKFRAHVVRLLVARFGTHGGGNGDAQMLPFIVDCGRDALDVRCGARESETASEQIADEERKFPLDSPGNRDNRLHEGRIGSGDFHGNGRIHRLHRLLVVGVCRIPAEIKHSVHISHISIVGSVLQRLPIGFLAHVIDDFPGGDIVKRIIGRGKAWQSRIIPDDVRRFGVAERLEEQFSLGSKRLAAENNRLQIGAFGQSFVALHGRHRREDDMGQIIAILEKRLWATGHCREIGQTQIVAVRKAISLVCRYERRHFNGADGGRAKCGVAESGQFGNRDSSLQIGAFGERPFPDGCQKRQLDIARKSVATAKDMRT